MLVIQQDKEFEYELLGLKTACAACGIEVVDWNPQTHGILYVANKYKDSVIICNTNIVDRAFYKVAGCKFIGYTKDTVPDNVSSSFVKIFRQTYEPPAFNVDYCENSTTIEQYKCDYLLLSNYDERNVRKYATIFKKCLKKNLSFKIVGSGMWNTPYHVGIPALQNLKNIVRSADKVICLTNSFMMDHWYTPMVCFIKKEVLMPAFEIPLDDDISSTSIDVPTGLSIYKSDKPIIYSNYYRLIKILNSVNLSNEVARVHNELSKRNY